MKEKYDNFASLYDAVLLNTYEEKLTQEKQKPVFKKAVLVSKPKPRKPKGKKFTPKKPHIKSTINWVGMSKKQYAKMRYKMKTAKKVHHKNSSF